MDEKRIPLLTEEPKYIKKSKHKGQPRSKHKHEYNTVLLHSYYEHPFDKSKTIERVHATKVCTICGRIDEVDLNQYEKIEVPDLPYKVYEDKIKNPETLENWYRDGYLAKFACKKDEVSG